MSRFGAARWGVRRRAGFACVAGGSALALTAVTLVGTATASSHREAPLIANDPAVDNTDVYAFTSPDRPDTVTMIANFSPFSDPNGGPNYFPFAEGAHYDINIDSDGDARPDVTYRWVFETHDNRDGTFLYNNGPIETLDDENLLFKQTYDLIKIDHNQPAGRGSVQGGGQGGGSAGNRTVLLDDQLAAPSSPGPASVPDYGALRDQATVDLPGGGQTYAGQADDPFFLDLRVFDLLYGGDASEVGVDTVAGFNVNTLAIQVPKQQLAAGGDPQANPVIGVWSDTEQRTMQLSPGKETPTGPHVQVSRLGNPLINEVISSVPLKDVFNASQPVDDAGTQPLLDRVTDPEVPKLVDLLYGIEAPETPRNDLVEVFLTGVSEGGPSQAAALETDLNAHTLNDATAENFQPSEQLRLNMSVAPTQESKQSRLGVLGGDLAGFPNGRRLADDVVDIELRVLEGAVRGRDVSALATLDSVDANDEAFTDTFPYVALPQQLAVAGQDAQNNGNTASTTGAGVSSTNAGDDGPFGLGDFFGAAGTGLPSLPTITGLGGMVLLGSGAWLLRRRPAAVPAG